LCVYAQLLQRESWAGQFVASVSVIYRPPCFPKGLLCSPSGKVEWTEELDSLNPCAGICLALAFWDSIKYAWRGHFCFSVLCRPGPSFTRACATVTCSWRPLIRHAPPPPKLLEAFSFFRGHLRKFELGSRHPSHPLGLLLFSDIGDAIPPYRSSYVACPRRFPFVFPPSASSPVMTLSAT